MTADAGTDAEGPLMTIHPRLTIHLGAHRTASSSTQMRLARMAEAGDLPGWQILPPRRIRSSFTRMIDGLAHAPGLARPWFGHLFAGQVMRQLSRGTDRILLSDENFLGPVDSSVLGGAGLYPRAAAHLTALRRMTAAHQPRVVLAVRSYADWWTSAYAMMSLRREMPRPDTLVRHWQGAPRRWPEIAADIIRLFGTCDVMCFEALATDPHAHVRALVGERASRAPDLHLHESFSREALDRIAGAMAANRRPPRGESLQALRREDRGKDKLNLFTAEARADLDRLYMRDLKALERTGARIVAPPPGPAP